MQVRLPWKPWDLTQVVGTLGSSLGRGLESRGATHRLDSKTWALHFTGNGSQVQPFTLSFKIKKKNVMFILFEKH